MVTLIAYPLWTATCRNGYGRIRWTAQKAILKTFMFLINLNKVSYNLMLPVMVGDNLRN